MPPDAPKYIQTTITPEEEKEMSELGITRVPADYFYFGEFRYTNLKDAIAQAKLKKAEN